MKLLANTPFSFLKKTVWKTTVKKKKQIFLLFFSFLFVTSSFAQTDTAFWFAAPAITASHENKPIVFRISTYSQPADITISQPANPSFLPYTFHLNSNTASTTDITQQLNQIENKPGNTILNYGIKVTSTTNISAYYEVGLKNNPEIFPLKGEVGKGLRFLIPSQTHFDNHAGHTPPAHNGFAIVATEDNTVIDITLTNADSIGHTANSLFTITLQKGQTYAVIAASNLASGHLGGSSVKANKPVCVTIYDDSVFLSPNYDLIGDQIVPEINTGSEFIIVRGALNYLQKPNQDFYYVWAIADTTEISENGAVVKTINRGQSYEGTLSNPSVYITTTKPVYILQFTGVGQEVAATSLPGIKCTGSQNVSFVRSTSEFFYLNILSKTTDISNFSLNGDNTVITPSLFQPVPGTNGVWQAARIDISNLPNLNRLIPAGFSTSVANSSGLFHLGFLNGGSGTGSRLGYFSNYSQVQLSPVVTSASCFGSDIQLFSTLYSNVTYQWSGPNQFTSTLNNPVIKKAAMIDGGKYYVTANIGGCGISKDSITVAVHDLPALQFVKQADTVCLGNSKNIRFLLTGKAPWNLIYTDGIKNDTINAITQNDTFFVKSPTVSAVYSIKNISDNNTCSADGTIAIQKDTLLVSALPVANFGYSPIRCEKNAVTFTDSSKNGLDTLTHWYWILGNGTVRDVTDKKMFTEVYASWGDYAVQLAVQSSLGCKSDTIKKVLTIHPLPKVGFILPEVCLNDASALFTDTTRLADGSLPKTYAWNFDAASALPVVPANKYPNPLSSAITNPSIQYKFSSNYQVKETVTSADGCIDSLTKSFTVNGSKPHAAFVVLDSTRLCSNRAVQLQDFSTVDFGNVARSEIFWNISIDSLDENPVYGKLYNYLYRDFQTPVTKKLAVKMIARSGNSSVCADSVTHIITLYQSPKVSFATIPGICNDTTARQIIQAKETGGVAGTFVYSGQGVNASGLFTPALVTPNTYPIKYSYTSTKGCSDSAIQNITTWPSPVARWGIGSPVCERNEILFTDSSVAQFGKILNRYWDFGNGTTINKRDSISFTKKYISASNYTASLRVMTDSGCRSTYVVQNLNVHYLPMVKFGMPDVCLPLGKGLFTDSSTIGDHSESLFTYAWNFGDQNDPAISLLKNPVHTYTALGPYTVQLKIASKDGCTDSLQQQLTTVYPRPNAAFRFPVAEICMADTIHFTDASNGYTGSIQSWHWDLAQGNTSILQNPYRQFADSGTFTIRLFINDAKGCISDTAMQSITVNPYPHLSLLKSLFVLQGGNTQLHPVFYASNPLFNWTPNLYLDTATIAYPITTPLNDITYQLQLTGRGNCSVTGSIFIKVLLGPVVPNAFSPNGDGINDTWIIQYLDSYPGCVVEVFARSGQTVFRSVGYQTPWDGTLDGKPLPIGTYYYVINPKNGKAVMSGSITLIK